MQSSCFIILQPYSSDWYTVVFLLIYVCVAVPSVFSLPQRKQDFSALLKGFSQMFLHSNDDRVLRNTAISLTHFAEGDHSRIDDVRAELKIVAENLKTKVLQHMREKDEATQETTNTDAQGDSSSDNSSDKSIGGDVKSKMENDLQFSLSLAVRKLAVLSKRSNISTLLGGEQLDELVSSLSQGIKKKIAFAREKMSSDLEGKPDCPGIPLEIMILIFL